MTIDKDYLRSVLIAFQNAPGPAMDIHQLREVGISHRDDKFLFHLQLLEDMHLIEPLSGRGGLGYTFGAAGDVVWSVIPLRLTAAGHEFAEALQRTPIWEAVKKHGQELTISSLMTVSKHLMTRLLATEAAKLLE